MDEFGVGLIVAAVLYGFRHGFDLDHLAAIGDIGASTKSRRRAVVLSSFYIAGHAAAVLVLGTGAVMIGAQVPAALDDVMGRIVGISLIALGVIVLYRAVRHRDIRLRSRWMLAADGVHALARRLHPARQVVVIEHTHEHDHRGTHDHGHHAATVSGHDRAVATMTATHAHAHRHIAAMPEDPFARYSSLGATGLGLLHGVGAETPSQILLFASAAGAATVLGGLVVLLTFVVGLVIANSIVAAAAAFGSVTQARWPRAYRVVAATAAVVSLVLGVVYAAGIEPAAVLGR